MRKLENSLSRSHVVSPEPLYRCVRIGALLTGEVEHHPHGELGVHNGTLHHVALIQVKVTVVAQQ